MECSSALQGCSWNRTHGPHPHGQNADSDGRVPRSARGRNPSGPVLDGKGRAVSPSFLSEFSRSFISPRTDTTIPGVFRIWSYPRPPSKSPSFSCEKLTQSSPSMYSRLSLDSLPSFHPIQPPKSVWRRVLDSLRSAISRSRPLPQPDLALPWHCMQPEDKIWYPLLVSGRRFVGRVDYSAPMGGQTVGEMRRWWFAELNTT
jgi:hypothetical protein